MTAAALRTIRLGQDHSIIGAIAVQDQRQCERGCGRMAATGHRSLFQ